MITTDLPWPPSVNTYWRSPNKGPLAGRTLISKRGREYRTAVITIVKANRVPAATGQLTATIYAYPPTLARRDVDNLPKAILDSLTHAGVMQDDSQIKRLVVEMMDKDPEGGYVRVILQPYERTVLD